MSRIVITGASGFLGRAIVSAATAAGHEVVGLTRADVDLADTEGLPKILAGADAVIHAAAGRGDDASHARDTQAATKNVIAAMPKGARLVLVSSFSIYAFDGMPDWAQLDETAPTDPDGSGRDAYARAKIQQEKLVISAAQTEGLQAWIARPGAIYGPDRVTTARLGWSKKGRWICLGGDAPVPAIHVDACARALVLAATVPDQGWPDDMPILTGDGHVRIINLVQPDPPTQTDWMEAIGSGSPIRLPRKPVMRAASVLGMIGDIVPKLGKRMPTALRQQTLAARFKPLRYSTHRLEQRLGFASTDSFAALMAASQETGA